jgi:CRP/FNR family transcriptional regulator, cyclic AMP receptor protein
MHRSNSSEPLQSLAQISIFASLPSAALERIRRSCEWRLYEPGQQIVHYEDTSDDVFFLTKGVARVTIYSVDGKAVSFRELGPGDLFGEYPAIDGGPRSASVEARTACMVGQMHAPAFLELLENEPKVRRKLLRQLVMTIRRLTNRIYEFSTLAVNNRIQAEVLRLANLANRDGKCACITPVPTHEEIASRLSTHREAVTRELNRLSKIGVLERQGNALLVRDVERLTAMVHEATGVHEDDGRSEY